MRDYARALRLFGLLSLSALAASGLSACNDDDDCGGPCVIVISGGTGGTQGGAGGAAGSGGAGGTGGTQGGTGGTQGGGAVPTNRGDIDASGTGVPATLTSANDLRGMAATLTLAAATATASQDQTKSTSSHKARTDCRDGGSFDQQVLSASEDSQQSIQIYENCRNGTTLIDGQANIDATFSSDPDTGTTTTLLDLEFVPDPQGENLLIQDDTPNARTAINLLGEIELELELDANLDFLRGDYLLNHKGRVLDREDNSGFVFRFTDMVETDRPGVNDNQRLITLDGQLGISGATGVCKNGEFTVTTEEPLILDRSSQQFLDGVLRFSSGGAFGTVTYGTDANGGFVDIQFGEGAPQRARQSDLNRSC